MNQTKASANRTAQGSGRSVFVLKNTHAKKTQAVVDEPIPVYSASGRVIGRVTDGTFHKNVKASRHMLRKPRGWAIDADTIAELQTLGVKSVTITDSETDSTYVASLTTFERYGVSINRGYGPQVVLPLGYWGVDGKPPRMGQPSQPAADAPRQLSLFAHVG